MTGDSAYGNSPGFRQGIAAQGHLYVLGFGRQHHVIYREQQWNLKELPEKLPESEWTVTTQRAGEQGPIEESWAFLRVKSYRH